MPRTPPCSSSPRGRRSPTETSPARHSCGANSGTCRSSPQEPSFAPVWSGSGLEEGAGDESVGACLTFKVLAEVGVSEADHRLGPFGDGLALEVDKPELCDDVHDVASWGGDHVPGRQVEHDPAAADVGALVGRGHAQERLPTTGGIAA